jgi:hypothetical protein
MRPGVLSRLGFWHQGQLHRQTATAVGTFLTVRQMQRQMEASYRPELTFARVFVKGEAESPQCPLLTRWTETPRFMEGWTGGGTAITLVKTSIPLGRFHTNLYNIGLGAVTGISITWSSVLSHILPFSFI